MNFCGECANMLYPKEDKVNRVLMYACRNCDHQEKADTYCVFRNEIRQRATEKEQSFHDVIVDPTLPRTKAAMCAKCGGREAVFFQAHANDSADDQAFTLIFVCCSPTCGHSWTE